MNNDWCGCENVSSVIRDVCVNDSVPWMSTLTAPEKGSWQPEESSSHSECALSAWVWPPETQRDTEWRRKERETDRHFTQWEKIEMYVKYEAGIKHFHLNTYLLRSLSQVEVIWYCLWPNLCSTRVSFYLQAYKMCVCGPITERNANWTFPTVVFSH